MDLKEMQLPRFIVLLYLSLGVETSAHRIEHQEVLVAGLVENSEAGRRAAQRTNVTLQQETGSELASKLRLRSSVRACNWESLLSAFPPVVHTILISLERQPERAADVERTFKPMGVEITRLAAADGRNAATISQAEIKATIAKPIETPSVLSKGNLVAMSHRRALESAARASEPWSLILEDDVNPLPITPERWLAGFQAALDKLASKDAAIVRLGWCEFENNTKEEEALGDGFTLVHHMFAANPRSIQATGGIYEGVCTSGYMVSKAYVADVLETFPLGSEPIDLHWAHTLWDRRPFSDKVYSIDHQAASRLYSGWAPFRQEGLVAQDQRHHPSVRARM